MMPNAKLSCSRLFLLLFGLVIVILLVLLSTTIVVDARKHDYNQGDQIPLYVKKIGPRVNPSETYNYLYLPYCSPVKLKRSRQGMGEVLEGGRKTQTAYNLPFQTDIENQDHCTAYLNEDGLYKFQEAIQRGFEIHMQYDDLPIKTKIGQIDSEGDTTRYFLYTHFHFEFQYNGDNVIDATVTAKKAQEVNVDDGTTPSGTTGIKEVRFSYSAKWIQTDTPYEKRMEKYNQLHFFSEEIEIQWFSIINSIVLVMLLTGFLVFIMMRILKKDYQRYNMSTTTTTTLSDLESRSGSSGGAAGDDGDMMEESGWKLLHGEVFRFPEHKSLLSAILGTGAQILTLCFAMLFLAVVGVFYPYSRGAMYTAIIVIYALVAGIAGYVSGSFYRQLGGKQWINNVLLTVSLFAAPVFVVWAFLNTVAIVYSSSAALPFGTIMGILAIYFLVTFPLTLLGAIAGKNFGGTFDRPCRPKNAVRVIPPAPWYRGAWAQFLVAGFLPFSAIYVELYYVFTSLWGTQLYTPYDILLLVFIILIVVAACITVALTYLQLSMEDHRWWWRSLFSGGSTAFFIYGYCVFFLHFESQMEGFLQLAFYFGYMFIICYAFFLMLGTVGFYSSLVFVRRIYRAIRAD